MLLYGLILLLWEYIHVFLNWKQFFLIKEEYSKKIMPSGANSFSHDRELLQGAFENHVCHCFGLDLSLIIFSLDLWLCYQFSFSGACWNGHKRKFFKNVQILVMQNCVSGRGVRYDLIQLSSFAWNPHFRDGQEMLMGMSHFSCLSHIPLSRNLGKLYHWKLNRVVLFSQLLSQQI